MSVQVFVEEQFNREYHYDPETREPVIDLNEQAAILRRAMTISWLGTVSTESEIMEYLAFSGVPIPHETQEQSNMFQELLKEARRQHRERPVDKSIFYVRTPILGVVHYGYSRNMFHAFNAISPSSEDRAALENKLAADQDSLSFISTEDEAVAEVPVEPAAFIMNYFMNGKSRKQLSMNQLCGRLAPEGIASLPKADVQDVLHRLRDDGMIELLRSKRTKNQYVIRVSQQVLADMLEMTQDGTYDEFLSMYAVQGCNKNVA